MCLLSQNIVLGKEDSLDCDKSGSTVFAYVILSKQIGVQNFRTFIICSLIQFALYVYTVFGLMHLLSQISRASNRCPQIFIVGIL